MSKVKINEAGGYFAKADPSGKRSKREIVLIRAGWGSSGYYSEDVLKRDGPTAFPIGTHMYMNHASRTEARDQPERRVEYLAAKTISKPRMRGIDLVAEAEIFRHWQPVVDEVADDIGVSIVAWGESEHGAAGGRHGDIITALTEGFSVDFVTKAGAGGRVGALIESAAHQAAPERLEEARNAANWFEARIHRDFTTLADYMFGEGYLTRDERIGLSAAIGEGLTSFNEYVEANVGQLLSRDPYSDPASTLQVEERFRMFERLSSEMSEQLRALGREKFRASDDIYVYIEDFDVDDKWVVYCVNGDGKYQYFKVSYTSGADGELALAGDPVEVDRVVTYNAVESGSSSRPEKGNSMGDENRLSELEESVRSLRSSQEETEKKLRESEERAEAAEKRADRAEDKIKMNEAKEIVAKAIAERAQGLPARAVERACKEALSGDLPMDDDKLDSDKLVKRAQEAVAEERQYLTGTSDAGRVTGMGVSEADLLGGGSGNGEATEDELNEVFQDLGLSESAAKVAAGVR